MLGVAGILAAVTTPPVMPERELNTEHPHIKAKQ